MVGTVDAVHGGIAAQGHSTGDSSGFHAWSRANLVEYVVDEFGTGGVASTVRLFVSWAE
jgi:hypothetical protein